MAIKEKKASRQKVGEELVALFVKHAILAGATLEQLSLETGRSRAEINRLLATFDHLEELLQSSDCKPMND